MQLYLDLAARLPVGILLALSATSVVLGDLFAKYWSVKQRSLFLILALIFYFGSGVFYVPTLLRQGLVITSLIWSLLGIIGFLVIGLVLFKEHLSPLQYFGVALGVAALVLLNFHK